MVPPPTWPPLTLLTVSGPRAGVRGCSWWTRERGGPADRPWRQTQGRGACGCFLQALGRWLSRPSSHRPGRRLQGVWGAGAGARGAAAGSAGSAAGPARPGAAPPARHPAAGPGELCSWGTDRGPGAVGDVCGTWGGTGHPPPGPRALRPQPLSQASRRVVGGQCTPCDCRMPTSPRN